MSKIQLRGSHSTAVPQPAPNARAAKPIPHIGTPKAATPLQTFQPRNFPSAAKFSPHAHFLENPTQWTSCLSPAFMVTGAPEGSLTHWTLAFTLAILTVAKLYLANADEKTFQRFQANLALTFNEDPEFLAQVERYDSTLTPLVAGNPARAERIALETALYSFLTQAKGAELFRDYFLWRLSPRYYYRSIIQAQCRLRFPQPSFRDLSNSLELWKLLATAYPQWEAIAPRDLDDRFENILEAASKRHLDASRVAQHPQIAQALRFLEDLLFQIRQEGQGKLQEFLHG